MNWTRSPVMRVLALAASLALVALHWEDRGPWFWAGVLLFVLNLTGWLANRSQPGRGDGRSPAPDVPAGTTLDDGRERSHRLEELLSVPGVAAALAAGPPVWRQVAYLDDAPVEPTTAAELAAFIWIEHDGQWTIGLGDEVKPYLDLDVDEDDDPVIRVLEEHPAVEAAFHEDREVYAVEQRRPIGTEEFAELAARALVSHHVDAAARL